MIRLKISYAIISAILLSLCYPPFNFNFIAFVAFIPLIIALEDADYKTVFFISLTFSTIFTAVLLNWIYIYHFIALPGLLIIMNIYSLAALSLYSFISKRLYYLDIFLFPIIWTSVEYLKSIGNFGFPWGNISYSQYNFLQFIQISEIIGSFGVTFIICLINSSLAFLILTHFKINRLIIQAVVVIILFFVVLLYGFDKIDKFRETPETTNLKIGVIQPNFSPYFFEWNENKNTVVSYLTDAVSKLALENLDLLLLSETIILDNIFWFNNALNKFEWHQDGFFWKYLFVNSILKTKTDILFGVPTIRYRSDGKINYFNSAVLLNSSGEILGFYDKIHLVPFGEFVPFYEKFDFVKKIADSLQCGNFVRGDNYTLLQSEKFSIAPLICYESIFHNLTRYFAKSGADFFVNITNDAWTNSTQAHYQHFYMNVFTAIQNRIPLVRCGNSGISGWINEIGELNNLSLPLTSTNYSFNMQLKKEFKNSFYTRYGDVFAQIIVILSGVLLFSSFFFSKKTPSFYY
ncbi:MAG TPA: apolipoprotein N-acyltransferase [bacterium]|nr:apolipoprotein N-acyltransferase [bacterium]